MKGKIFVGLPKKRNFWNLSENKKGFIWLAINIICLCYSWIFGVAFGLFLFDIWFFIKRIEANDKRI